MALLHPFPAMCNRLISSARKATFLEMRAGVIHLCHRVIIPC